jgi:hypothetical protein
LSAATLSPDICNRCSHIVNFETNIAISFTINFTSYRSSYCITCCHAPPWLHQLHLRTK